MNSIKLAIRNIRGNSVRSLIIFLCVFGVAGFFVVTTLIVTGAQNSLQRGLERLGADILVVPQGAESKVETALLMGKPTEVWMSDNYLKKLPAYRVWPKYRPRFTCSPCTGLLAARYRKCFW